MLRLKNCRWQSGGNRQNGKNERMQRFLNHQDTKRKRNKGRREKQKKFSHRLRRFHRERIDKINRIFFTTKKKRG
jgi:hypothetical protein